MKFDKFVEIMARLRASQGGCPWDLEQTPDSLKPYIIEEAYELLEAIDKKNPEEIRHELGDLLLQIVFQARIQEEVGNFTIYDVVDSISEKMIRRHPHIFGDAVAKNSEEVRTRWEEIKKLEFTDRKSVLDGTPKSLPALLRANRITKKAANVGFDWPDCNGPMEKIKEELNELKEAIDAKDDNRIFMEIGDLIFSVVNLARHFDVNPEDALNACTEKFIKRFSFIENEVGRQGKKMENCTLAELDAIWNKAKTQLK